MKKEMLVDQSYWDNSYREIAPFLQPPADALSTWLREHLKPVSGKDCIEIGCYPGRYLSLLGEMGYTLNGLDLTPGIDSMKQVFAQKFKTGEFTRADFLQYKPTSQYALVASFGFIEHFDDWATVLRRHADMVEPGGMIVIETPNFRGSVQRRLHRWLDAENLKRHNLDAMQPDKWAMVLSAMGFEIMWSGYFGRFEFWHDSRHHHFFQRLLLRMVRKISPILKRRNPGSASLSPYAGIIAIKRSA
ncbi:MAG: class I SAM-dependent methyltransferase [Flavobacteriales bacterium]|nr:class I SAM-dependent methyltransferase [Flavobacteriales bacterium]